MILLIFHSSSAWSGEHQVDGLEKSIIGFLPHSIPYCLESMIKRTEKCIFRNCHVKIVFLAMASFMDRFITRSFFNEISRNFGCSFVGIYYLQLNIEVYLFDSILYYGEKNKRSLSLCYWLSAVIFLSPTFCQQLIAYKTCTLNWSYICGGQEKPLEFVFCRNWVYDGFCIT